MSGIKITELPASTTPLSGSEIVPLVQGGVTKRATVTQIGTVTATGATTPRTLPDRFADTISVKDFGAVGNGVTDDTAAIQAAINTSATVFFPRGTYLLTNAITISQPGQHLVGEGRNRTVFLVTSSFNLSATAVFVAATAEPGPVWRDLRIKFTQPDTSVRASLIAYPPAIYAQSTPRFTIQNVAITGAKVGIDMRGNSGGAFIDLLEMSAFDKGIQIDGSLDSVRLTKWQYWPFDLTANQTDIFFDASNLGLECGRCDDLHVENCLFINGGTHIRFYSSAAGTAFGNILNTDFDNTASIKFEGGNINIAACIFTLGNAAYQAIRHSGGQLRVVGSKFEAAVALNQPMIEMTGNALRSFLSISGCKLDASGDNTVIKAASSGDTAHLIFCNNQIAAPTNTTPSNSLVTVNAGARIIAIGNSLTDKGTGSGNWIEVQQDNHHQVIGNTPVGWGQSIPAPYSSTSEFANGTADAWRSYVTTLTAQSGSFTSANATMKYKQIGKTMFVRASVVITTNGTAANSILLDLPAVAVGAAVGFGREVVLTGIQCSASVLANSRSLEIVAYDNSYPGGSGRTIHVGITIEIA